MMLSVCNSTVVIDSVTVCISFCFTFVTIENIVQFPLVFYIKLI